MARLFDVRLASEWKHIRRPGSRFPRIEFGLWIAGTLYQLIRQLVTHALDFDHLILLVAAKTALNGFGWGALLSPPEDISRAVFAPMDFWPIGWSILVSPFIAIFNDLFWATYLSEAAGILLFFLALATIVERIGGSFDAVSRLALVFFLGFVVPPSAGFSHANMWTASLFAAAAALVIPGKDGPPSALACFIAGCLVAATVWMRYQCAFSALGIGLVLLSRDLWSAPGRRRVAAHALGIGILFGALYYWRFHYVLDGVVAAGKMDRRAVPGGFFPENLLLTPPVAGIALLGDAWNPQLLLNAFPNWASEVWAAPAMDWMGWLLFVCAVLGGVLVLTSRENVVVAEKRSLRRFYAVAAAGIGLNLLLLAYVSVIRDMKVTGWVFLQVYRYHVIGGAFIMITLAHLLSAPLRSWNAPFKLFVIVLLGFVAYLRLPLVPEVLKKFAQGEFAPPLEDTFYYGPAITNDLRHRFQPGQENVFLYIGPDYVDFGYKAAQAQLLGYSAIRHQDPRALKSKTAVNLVVCLPWNGSPLDQIRFKEICEELKNTPVGLHNVTHCGGLYQSR